jgi:hypothetical protein
VTEVVDYLAVGGHSPVPGGVHRVRPLVAGVPRKKSWPRPLSRRSGPFALYNPHRPVVKKEGSGGSVADTLERVRAIGVILLS